MMLYAYITVLYVLFRVVLSAWRKILEKRAKFTKYHERLFYSRFRVVVSSLALPFRVVWPTLPEAFRVAVFSSAKKTVKTPKYHISCSHVALALPGEAISCSHFTRQQPLLERLFYSPPRPLHFV